MSRLRALLLASTLMSIAACGGADDIASPGKGAIVITTPTPPTSPAPPTVPPGTPAAACPVIEGVTDAGTLGAFRLCRLPSSITTDRRLTRVDNLAYLIDGRVDVGIDLGGSSIPNSTGRSAILTIDAGVILVANSGDQTNDLLVVNRGSRLALGIKRMGNGSSDPRNLEVDSNNNREAAPRQFLRLANFTFISPLNFENILIRGGADATLVNGIVRGLGTGACLNIDHPETIRAATNSPPADPASGVSAPDRGPPAFNSVVLECASAFRDNDNNVTGAEIQAIFSAGTNNNAAAANSLSNLYFAGPGASAVTAFNAATLNPAGDSFLVTTNFIGAVSASNQAEYQGWTCNSGYATFGAASLSCTTLPSV